MFGHATSAQYVIMADLSMVTATVGPVFLATTTSHSPPSPASGHLLQPSSTHHLQKRKPGVGVGEELEVRRAFGHLQPTTVSRFEHGSDVFETHSTYFTYVQKFMLLHRMNIWGIFLPLSDLLSTDVKIMDGSLLPPCRY